MELLPQLVLHLGDHADRVQVRQDVRAGHVAAARELEEVLAGVGGDVDGARERLHHGGHCNATRTPRTETTNENFTSW